MTVKRGCPKQSPDPCEARQAATLRPPPGNPSPLTRIDVGTIDANLT